MVVFHRGEVTNGQFPCMFCLKTIVYAYTDCFCDEKTFHPLELLTYHYLVVATLMKDYTKISLRSKMVGVDSLVAKHFQV